MNDSEVKIISINNSGYSILDSLAYNPKEDKEMHVCMKYHEFEQIVVKWLLFDKFKKTIQQMEKDEKYPMRFYDGPYFVCEEILSIIQQIEDGEI